MQERPGGMIWGTGTNSASQTLGPEVGRIWAKRLGWDSPGAGTLTLYRANAKTTANAAVSNSTTLVIDTNATGGVGSGVLTANDFVLVYNSSGTGNATYLQQCSSVGTVSSSTVSLTLDGAIYCSASDRVYVIRAANIVVLTTAEESVRDLYDAFVSFPSYPVHLVLAATGTCRFNGTYVTV